MKIKTIAMRERERESKMRWRRKNKTKISLGWNVWGVLTCERKSEKIKKSCERVLIRCRPLIASNYSLPSFWRVIIKSLESFSHEHEQRRRRRMRRLMIDKNKRAFQRVVLPLLVPYCLMNIKFVLPPPLWVDCC